MDLYTPYWPLKVGSNFNFDIFTIRGNWPTTGNIVPITYRQKAGPAKVSILSGVSNPFCNNASFKYFYYPEGGKGLNEGWDYVAGIGWYIGEAINQDGAVYKPFLPKMPLNPKEGTNISGTSSVFKDGVYMGQTPWVFRVVKHRDWGQFTDCWITFLQETKYGSYNYVFKNGVGLVDFWYVDPTGKGLEYYATNWVIPQ